jgi:hypothetical protein
VLILKQNPIKMKTKLTLFALLIVSLSYAQSKNLKKSFSNEVETSATVSEAWNLVTDVSQWKTWNSHIIDARLDGAFTEKSKGILITSNSKVEPYTVVKFVENESYTIRHKLSSGLLYLKRSVKAADKGSKISTEVWVTGLSSKNFDKYMGDDYKNTLANELANAKQMLEKEGLAAVKL